MIKIMTATTIMIIILIAVLLAVTQLPRPIHAFICPSQSKITTQHHSSVAVVDTRICRRRNCGKSTTTFETHNHNISRLHAGKGFGKEKKKEKDNGFVVVDNDDKEKLNNVVEEIIIDDDTQHQQEMKSIDVGGGDPLRKATGIRPSIHPTSINAIAESLKARAVQTIEEMSSGSNSRSGDTNNNDGDDYEKGEKNQFYVTDTIGPLEVMLTAGQFASNAIQKRQEASEETNDGMKMNQSEEQTVAGRVMGVIMRLQDLENELIERTMNVEWVAKYNEWSSFGVLEDECKYKNNRDKNSDDDDDDNDDDANGMMNKVHEKIIDDPLFRMNRAECLLGIFLQEVEIPQFQKLNETAPDGSKIDFLDTDRFEVIIQSLTS